MGIDSPTLTRTEIDLPALGRKMPKSGPFTIVAIFDGKHWAALCRELDIASDGESAVEAVLNAKNAAREALAVARERGLSPGSPVSTDALLSFLRSHRGPAPMAAQVFFDL
jgi:predicted RNase H-like HicB family nuclease